MNDGRESSAKRGYGSRWRRYRETFLRNNPLCAMHLDLGFPVVATVVDHKIPHKGDQTLFWDRDNHQALCKACHDRHKQREERGGPVVGCSSEGVPIDPRHHWHRS